jgi:hypothetical protein
MADVIQELLLSISRELPSHFHRVVGLGHAHRIGGWPTPVGLGLTTPTGLGADCSRRVGGWTAPRRWTETGDKAKLGGPDWTAPTGRWALGRSNGRTV